MHTVVTVQHSAALSSEKVQLMSDLHNIKGGGEGGQ